MPLARAMRQAPTPAEARLWKALRGRRTGGPRFRRQHALGPFIADFYCPEARLVVEVDGPIHNRRSAADAERQAYLNGAGFRVVRFTNDGVLTSLDGVLEAIWGNLTPDPSPPEERGGLRGRG